MADNKIPVEIEVRLDERSVGVSMEALKSRVKSQGREIGDALTETVRLSPRSIEEQLVNNIKQATGGARRAMERLYSELFAVDSFVRSVGTKNMIEAKIQSDLSSLDRNRLQRQFESAFGDIVSGWGSGVRSVGTKNIIESRILNELSSVDKARLQQGYERLWGSMTQSFVGPQLPKSFGNQNLMQGVITGNEQAIRSMAKLHGEANKINRELDSLPTLWERINVPLKKVALLTTELTRAFFGLSLAIGTVGLPAIIGVKFIKELEDAKMGVAGIVTSMMSINGVALTAEQGISVADNAIKELTKSAHKYGLSVSDVVTTFRAITASGTSANMTLGEIRDLATIGTLAVKGIGLDSRQVVQEVRDLVAGGIQPASSTLATALGLRDKDIKAAKESAEGLYKFLIGKLQGFAEVAAYARDKTMSGILDSITIKIQTAFADEKLFGGIKDFLKRISDSIGTIDKLTGDIKLTDEFKEMAEGYLWFIESIGMLVKSVVYGLGDMLGAVKKVKDELGAFGSAAEWAAGAALASWILLPKKIVDAFLPMTGFLSGIGVTSSTDFATEWTKSESTFKKVGLALGAALRTGAILGLTGFITYELTKEIIEANDPLKKFTLQLVGGFLIAGSKIAEVFEKSVSWVTYLIDKSVDILKRGIKGVLDSASGAAKFIGLDGMATKFSGASSSIALNSVSPEETRDKSLAAASEKHNKYVGDLVRSYGELTYRMTDAGKAQQKINEEQLKSTNAYIKSAAAMDELGKSLGTTESKRKAYVSQLSNIDAELKALIATAELDKKTKSDPEQRANIDKNIAYYKKQAEEMRNLAKAKYQASLVDKEAIKHNKKEFREALEIEKVFADQQDMLVQEGAKTYLEAYNLKINKIKELSKQNETNIKWEERRNEAYKVVSDYLTKSNTQLTKEAEKIEATTAATLKYGAAVEVSSAALLKEQYAKEGLLESGFKELALLNVLAQSRKDLAKIHADSVKAQLEAEKELGELVTESYLMFLETEKQKSEFKLKETLKRINAERTEAEKSLELNLALKMNAGPLSPQEYEDYLKTKEAINKSFADREETAKKIFNQRMYNAELKDAKETVDKIEGTFKEAFMKIAEHGTSGWKEMLNKFKSDFKRNIIEYIYKELAKPFVLNVIAQVTGAMGMSSISQAASKMGSGAGSNSSSIGSMLSMGSNLSSLAGGGSILGGFGAGFSSMAGEMAMGANFVGPSVSLASGSVGAGAATASAMGSTAAGMMSSVAAAAPYVLAALAVADAVGAFGKRGGPQQGQYSQTTRDSFNISHTSSGGAPLDSKALASAVLGQVDMLYSMAGRQKANVMIDQGYGFDPQGTSQDMKYRKINIDGRQLTSFDDRSSRGDSAGAAAMLSHLTSREIEAIASAINDSKLNGIIETLKANFGDLATAMEKYAVGQAKQQALLSLLQSDEDKHRDTANSLFAAVGGAFNSLNVTMPDSVAGLHAFVAGLDLTTKSGADTLATLDALGPSLVSYIEAAKKVEADRRSWQEKLDVLNGTTTEKELERSRTLASTSDTATQALMRQVWALEDQKEATDAATESLKELQSAALEGVNESFNELINIYESEISAKETLIDKTKNYVKQLKEFSQSLSLGELSTLNPLGKYEAAKSAFDVVSQRAMSGDSAAIEQLQGVSEAYLQASREYYASNVQYADDYNKVQSAISKTVSVAEQQITAADAQLMTMRQQLSSLTQINESTKSVESAIGRLQTALLESVRAGNIGDVGEQAKMASGLIKGGAGELYNPLTDAWSNKGQSATTSQIREWGAKILNEQGPMALYEATKSVGLSMNSVNIIAGWKAGTAEEWAKANNLPTFANGGFVKPGWAMVGERGPELVRFGATAQVYTADQTSRMTSGSGDNELYLQQVIIELQALIRQNGASAQAMIMELQQVKAELEDLRSRTRLRDGTNG